MISDKFNIGDIVSHRLIPNDTFIVIGSTIDFDLGIRWIEVANSKTPDVYADGYLEGDLSIVKHNPLYLDDNLFTIE